MTPCDKKSVVPKSLEERLIGVAGGQGVDLMVPFTGQQDRNFWQSVGLFMVARQVRLRLQRLIICHVIM